MASAAGPPGLLPEVTAVAAFQISISLVKKELVHLFVHQLPV